MIFWILAAVVLTLAALISCFPLIRTRSGWTPIAIVLVFLVPASVLMVYPYIGTPEALNPAAVITPAAPHAGQNIDIDALVANLRNRLTESPEHLDGWLLLSKTLKTMQRYPQALEAAETAYRIAPENPMVLVELVEARIFVSGQGQFDDEMITLLKDAIRLDPGQQKGLWMLGVASAQSQDDAAAIEYWQQLLQLLDPDGTVAASVQEQITEAQQRLGLDSSPSAGQEGIKLHLSAGDELNANVPPGAVLFIIIRSVGPVAGPPLGVRRIDHPVLPLEVTINDQDSMMEARKISSVSELRIQARLSLSGGANAQSGDWQSAPITVPLNTTTTVQLSLDQQVD